MSLYNELDWSSWPDKPEEQTFNDWNKVRKAKRCPTTQTAINRTAVHIRKLVEEDVCSVDFAVQIAATRGWAGIKYAWVIKAIHDDQEGLVDPFSKYLL